MNTISTKESVTQLAHQTLTQRSKEESTEKLMRLKKTLVESELELKEVESMYVSNEKELNWKTKSTGKRQIELRSLEIELRSLETRPAVQDQFLKEKKKAKKMNELVKLDTLIKKLMNLKKDLSAMKMKLEIAKNSKAKQSQKNLELRWKLRKQKEKNLKLKVDLSNKYTQSKINFNYYNDR